MPIPLSLKSLAKVAGGRVGIKFDSLLKGIVGDCIDRPGIAQDRTLTLKLTIKPRPNDQGDCDDVLVRAEVERKMPGFKTDSHPMMIHANHELGFEPDAPDNPRQKTLLDPEDEA